jgi:hypothetical protein
MKQVLQSMAAAEDKLAFNARAKASMRLLLQSKSWPEKVRSIERMNEASKLARAAMEAARAKAAR